MIIKNWQTLTFQNGRHKLNSIKSTLLCQYTRPIPLSTNTYSTSNTDTNLDVISKEDKTVGDDDDDMAPMARPSHWPPPQNNNNQRANIIFYLFHGSLLLFQRIIFELQLLFFLNWDHVQSSKGWHFYWEQPLWVSHPYWSVVMPQTKRVDDDSWLRGDGEL